MDNFVLAARKCGGLCAYSLGHASLILDGVINRQPFIAMARLLSQPPLQLLVLMTVNQIMLPFRKRLGRPGEVGGDAAKKRFDFVG